MNASDLLNNLVSYNMTTDYTAEESKVAQEYMAIIMKRAEEEYRRAFQLEDCMKLHLCPKHENQKPLQIQEEHRKSGDRIFKVKCPVCGKLGPWRKTIHGAQMAWNESTNFGG